MSRTWLEGGPLVVGTFAGPSGLSEDRARWQFTVRDGSDVAVLGREDAKLVLLALAASIGWWCEPRAPLAKPGVP